MLVTGVQNEVSALGYFGLAYYVENKEKLKLLAVDNGDGNCVQPTTETVRANTYRPLSRPLFIYVNTTSLQRPEVSKFVDYYLEHSSALAADVGYVPVSDDVASENTRRVAEAAQTQDAVDAHAAN